MSLNEQPIISLSHNECLIVCNRSGEKLRVNLNERVWIKTKNDFIGTTLSNIIELQKEDSKVSEKSGLSGFLKL